ncbi:FxLYD domain-containing protein [Paenarthrobacter sp. NPDC056912]|uniref:FxLYD domain-containing protein n=1 Tax=Paenarthrobacter sp. NPDC056912 TaxID=3345965 RepID=UPI00366FB4FE
MKTDSKIEFTVASRPVTGKPYFRDLKVDQANIAGENVTGKATNSSDDKLSGPYSVHVTCFDEKGAMLDTLTGYASPSADIAAGQSVTFQIGLADKACPSFLLGVSGYEALK